MRKLIAICAIAFAVGSGAASTAHATDHSSPTWATLNQRANAEIKAGGIYSRGWGAASPKLKSIVTQMIYMKFGDSGREALCYAQRESDLNPYALSRTGDHHVFQLNYVAHHQTFDFVVLDHPNAPNFVGYGIIAAWRLSQGGTNFSPWAGGSHSC